MNDYEIKKTELISGFKKILKEKSEVALDKSSPSNLYRNRKGAGRGLDVRQFNKVISIDAKNKTAEVEGMTTFEDLVTATLKYGLLPPVVSELKTITIGGAVSGIGIESSSFRFGLVHETVLEMDVLLGNGEVVTCTKTNPYKDLFFAIPNSYGTFGYILKLKIKLVPAKKFVKIEHLNYDDAEIYFKDLKKLFLENKKHGYDFIDGTIFSEDEMYITLGKFVDDAPFVSNYKYMNMYFKSIKNRKEDYLSSLDYVWRWDTDWFWGSKHFLMQNTAMRLFFGKFILGSKSYWKIKKFYERYLEKLIGKKGEESIVQDVAIPIENCIKFLEFFHKKIGIKPIWICPTSAYDKKSYFTMFPLDTKKLYVDIAFWDVIKSAKEDGYYNRLVEEMAVKLNGLKSLYSKSYYTEDEFWSIFDKNLYFGLKRKYDPNKTFKNLYDKCVKAR